FLQAAVLMVSFVAFIFAVNKGGQAAVAVSSHTPGAAADGIAAAALLAVSIAAAGIFAWMSRRSFSPLIRLGVFRSITFRWALAAYILMQICQISFGYVIPNSAQLGFGASALVGGFLILPGALFGAFLAPWAGSLLDKYGPKRPVLSAMVLTFAGVLLFMVFMTPGSPVYLLGIFYFVFMMGYSMSFANSMTCALNTLDPEFKADGNAVFNSFNQLSGALGTTLMSALVSISQVGLAPGTQQYQFATVRGSHWCYIVMVAAIGCSIVCLIRAFSGRPESRSQKGRDSDKIADDRVQYPGNN
ncbi:MAG: MFS transporter, partial [Scardovia wiggsiae]